VVTKVLAYIKIRFPQNEYVKYTLITRGADFIVNLIIITDPVASPNAKYV
jgi:hypothetical protein